MTIEKIILKNLLRNEKFTNKVLPFLKEDYFAAELDKTIFQEIHGFIGKYNKPPTFDALEVEVAGRNITEETAKKLATTLSDLKKDTDDTDLDWLVKSTEEFCQQRAIHNAILKSIDILNGKGNQAKGAIPTMLSDAISITFDPNVGHDYFEDAQDRFDYYHRVEEKIPCDLDMLNKILKGGVAKKTLNMIMGGVHCVAPQTLVTIRFRKKHTPI